MRRIKVLSKKYDDYLRDEPDAYLYSSDGGTITLLSPAGTRYYDHRQGVWSEAPDGLLEIYLQDRWYNVWHIGEQNSRRNLMYANICLPATLNGNILKWVDLDLDYRVHMDGRIELLDEKEFERNINQFGYSGWVVENVGAACDEVMDRFERGEFRFDHPRQAERYRTISADQGLVRCPYR